MGRAIQDKGPVFLVNPAGRCMWCVCSMLERGLGLGLGLGLVGCMRLYGDAICQLGYC